MLKTVAKYNDGTVKTRLTRIPAVKTPWDQLRQIPSALRIGLACAALMACSCTSSFQTVSLDPFLEQHRPSSDSTGVVRVASVETPASQSKKSTELSRPVNQKQNSAAVFLQPVVRENPVRTTPRQAEARVIHGSGPEHVQSVEPHVPVRFTAAEPRIPIQRTHSNGQGQPNSTDSGYRAAAEANKYPDEYLLDGGDRVLPIHYDQFHRLGIDTKDTIAEYVDHLGRRRVQPSNRVAIYAPRFSAIRTVSSPEGSTSIEQLVGTVESSRTSGLRNRLAPSFKQRHSAASRIRMRSRGSGLASEFKLAGVDHRLKPEQHVKLLGAFADLTFLQTGKLLQTERSRLAKTIQAAAVWSRNRSPAIAAHSESLHEVHAWFKPQELIGCEDKHQKTGRLRIVKMADRETASPEEIVTFTIRYDNLGDRELHQIRIVDNLTPRLQYIDDSATSDRPGQLVVEDNGEGSLVLRFELDDSLPGHQGGVLTFQARVQ